LFTVSTLAFLAGEITLYFHKIFGTLFEHSRPLIAVCGQSVCTVNIVQCRTLLGLVQLASEFAFDG